MRSINGDRRIVGFKIAVRQSLVHKSVFAGDREIWAFVLVEFEKFNCQFATVVIFEKVTFL